MAIISQRDVEEDQLHKQFHHLQDDWKSYQQSVPLRRRSSCSTTEDVLTTFTTADLLELMHDSPKKLVSSLQQTHPPPKVGDRAVEAIVAERHAAIHSGKLRGRRLLEALERARDEAGLRGGEEICSVCPSVLVQDAEVNSSSYCSSCIGERDYPRNEHYVSSSSSSSSSSSLEKEMVEEVERKIGGISGDGGKWWMVRMALFAIIAVVLAFGLISLSESGMEEYGDFMIPT